MTKNKLIKLLSVLLAAAAIFSFSGCDEELLEAFFSEENVDVDSSNENREGPYEVVKVVDGDTIKLMIDGEKKNVRLIGVDTPESVHPDASKNVPEGTLASDHTKALVGDNMLYIEYGVEREDHYGRPLCYVYLPDGTMLNEQLLIDGYADVLFVGSKNSMYKDHFYELRDEARDAGRGLWSTGVFDKD